MQKYIWIEKYGVGVKEIDKQHQHYFEIVREIIRMTEEEKISSEDLMVKITNLNDYAIYHFTTEENLFKHYVYPDAKEHIEAHDTYRERMDEFIIKAKKEGADTKRVIIDIAEFAGRWLVNHIMETDQKYVEFMHKNGVK